MTPTFSQRLADLAATPVGQAALSFLRVALAALVASWVNAGMPVRELSGSSVLDWIELAVQAGAALVIANYFGPWEQRYGVSKKQTF